MGLLIHIYNSKIYIIFKLTFRAINHQHEDTGKSIKRII